MALRSSPRIRSSRWRYVPRLLHAFRAQQLAPIQFCVVSGKNQHSRDTPLESGWRTERGRQSGVHNARADHTTPFVRHIVRADSRVHASIRSADHESIKAYSIKDSMSARQSRGVGGSCHTATKPLGPKLPTASLDDSSFPRAFQSTEPSTRSGIARSSHG